MGEQVDNASVYAPLVAWEVWNFMSFEHARFDFDTSNVVNVKGYNDSGKSASLRALDVLMYNISPNKKVDFFQDGKDYFSLVAYFADGVSILRDKYINGQSLYEMYKGEECIFSTKNGKTLARISEVPQPIQDYLGLLSYESTRLNSRSCFEKQIGVQNTGSENFKMFNVVLKSEELASASNMLNADKNKLVSDMDSLESDLRACKDLTLIGANLSEAIISYLENEDISIDTCEKMEGILTNIKSGLIDLSSVPNYPEVNSVDMTQLGTLESIYSILDNLATFKDYPEIETIDLTQLDTLLGIHSSLVKLQELVDVPEIAHIDATALNALSSIIDTISDISNIDKVIAEIDTGIANNERIIKECEEQMKSLGVHVVKCPNCGTVFPADEEHVD